MNDDISFGHRYCPDVICNPRMTLTYELECDAYKVIKSIKEFIKYIPEETILVLTYLMFVTIYAMIRLHQINLYFLY